MRDGLRRCVCTLLGPAPVAANRTAKPTLKICREGAAREIIASANDEITDATLVSLREASIKDLKTLYVTNDGNNYPHRGSLTAIDPTTGRPIKTIKVDDPYNMYFTPDGSSAIVVAPARQTSRSASA